MSEFRFLAEGIAVAPQLQPEDCATAAAAGFRLVVNNRPDGEAPGQPAGAEIEAAAHAAGLRYAAIPIGPEGLTLAAIEACAALLADAPGPVLLFCRSGTRSANLAALARARLGHDIEPMIERAAAQGYALAGLRPLAARLAPRTA
ncbi:TIGR01244 family sulfur transferase [Thermaurantiacus sp.]